MQLLSVIPAMLAVLSFVVLPCLATDAAIISPANGTAIAPGASFPFSYRTMADYGISSYNFTVWLFTSPPISSAASHDWAKGYYFGRYSQANYPGNPYPTNPPPTNLVMPNFTALGGGFGSGAPGSNVVSYLTVIEEYETFTGSVGYRLSLSYNHILYNATAK